MLPSDNMSRKELNAMNGEVKTFNLNKPMTIQQFKKMPDDLKKEYLLKLRNLFNASDGTIAEMLGCHRKTLGRIAAELKISIGRGKPRGHFEKEAWEQFIGGEGITTKVPVQQEEVTTEVVETDDVEPIATKKEESIVVIPESGNMTFHGNANDTLMAIQRILQNANVRLTVIWEIEETKG